jgi:3'-5' exonuclease
MEQKIKEAVFTKEWTGGKGGSIFYHNVTFVDGTTWNIGAKQANPDFLKAGQVLEYEIADAEKKKIKRAKKEFGSFSNFKKMAPPSVNPNSTSLVRMLDKYPEEEIIFFDIETCRGVDQLKKGTALYDAWEYKSRYNNELNRKTGETYSMEEYFVDKAALYAPFAKVVCIVAGKIKGSELKVKEYKGDESDLLKDFNEDIKKILSVTPNAVLCGWANVGFDQPFLMKRMLVHGIQPNLLLDTAHLKPWELAALDLKSVWQATSFYPDSLQSVAVTMGLPTPKSGMDGSQVSDAFFEGKIDDIVKYCAQDVLACANIYRKFVGGTKVSL